MQNNLVLLHLSLIEGVGPATVATLTHSSDDLTMLYTCTECDLVALKGLSPASAKKVVAGLQDSSLLEKELALIERHGIQWATVQSAVYPELLRPIYLPPVILYWRGTLQMSGRVLAIVGSRKASRYGQMAIERMVPDLVEHGVCIVSGGAMGADSMAHAATLDAGGQTLAVIGSGLLEPYPAFNKKLFERMADEGGAVVSSFPLETKPHPGNFPARNRIIAGMSHACLVVQAAERSGALITAQFALDQGKEILAVPGMINDPLSGGCHDLIRNGAFLAASAQDVLAVFGEFKEMAVVGSVGPSDESAQQLVLGAPLADDESLSARIIRACAQPRALEDLVFELDATLEEVMKELFELQLKGKVHQNFAGLWQIT